MQTASTKTPEPQPASPLSKEGYRTSPDHETTGWPPGVPYIVGNEACERFSFYGMNAILAAHLASLYALHHGLAEKEAQDAATAAVHLFKAGVYALPMIGAILAERLIGKYRTIFYVSIIYCIGHVVLSLGERYLEGMFLGLALIAIGSGGIKPCVSANVGDQFGRNNWFRVRGVFQIFYFSINFGSFFATLLIPQIQNHAGRILIGLFPSLEQHISARHLGTSIAFAVPGVLMFIATYIFWLGRKKFVHVPPKPGGRLGWLDAVSSILIFMTIGHLFFTTHLIEGLKLSDWTRENLQGLAERAVHLAQVFRADAGFDEGVALVAGAIRWALLLALSASFLVAGLYVFGRRQQVAQDDGFLAIVFYAWRNRGRPANAAVNGENGDSWLARSTFWGPAVDRFGLKAVEGPMAVFKIISVFILISVFWALFDQHSTSWIFQAGQMDLWLWGDGRESFLGIPNTLLDKNQVPALNPLMVMILIPVMNWVYSRVDRLGIQTTPLRRITVGMFIAAASFAVVALLQHWIDREAREDLPRLTASTVGLLATPPGPGALVTASSAAVGGTGHVWFAWQVIPYLLITVAEVMVSITGLEFAYTQAPARMKSTIMGFWLLTVALGNVLVAFLAGFKDLERVNFFWTFAGLSLAAGLLFAVRAYFYVPKDYTQE